MQTFQIKYLAVFLSSWSFLTACQSTPNVKPNVETDISVFDQELSTRVFYGDCLRTVGISDNQSAALSIFGSALISNSLDRIGNALRKAGEEDAHVSTAHRNLQVSPPKTTQCVQVIRAKFISSSNSWKDSQSTPPTSTLSNLNSKSTAFIKGATGDTLEGMTDRLGKSDITAFTDHSFIFEGQLRPSIDDSALTLVPTFYDYPSAIKPKRSAKKKYAVLLSISVHNPGTSATDSNATGTSIALGAIKPRTHKIYAIPSKGTSGPNDTPWFTNFAPKPPAVSSSPATRVVTVSTQTTKDGGITRTETFECEIPRTEDASKCFEIKVDGIKPESPIKLADPLGKSAPVNSRPRILTATITETEAADKVLLFFADVFDASKESLGTEIGNRILPDQRNASNLADFTSNQQALIAYYTDVSEAETAKNSFCQLPPDTSSTELRARATEAYTAQIEANIAAMSTDFGVPYPVPIDPTGTDNTDCP